MTISVKPNNQLGTHVVLELDEGALKVPIFPLSAVKESQCARYARLTAEELFGKNFTATDSWNRQYHDKTVAKVEDSTLEKLASKGILKPGMIIGVYCPSSEYNGWTDQNGKPATYTHNALYLGTKEGIAILAEQVDFTVFIRNEQEHRNAGMRPIEIFDAPQIL